MAANPSGEDKNSSAQSRGVTPARIAVIAVLAVAVIALGYVIFNGNGEHKYNLLFQNASQLVPDNQVLIGGQPVGSVESIELTDDNLAKVVVSVRQELHEGTTATIRATSLSGVANHYVSISPGPNSNPPLENDATLGLASTTTPIDIDQLFNTFPAPVRRGLAQFIEGNAQWYAGRGRDGTANDTFKYIGVGFNRAGAFAHELNADEKLFSRFLVSSSRLGTTVSERGAELSSAIANANAAFGAIASQNAALGTSLQLLPPTFRQANTTFVNLRAALDDVEPLINTSKTATKDLAPFLGELRAGPLQGGARLQEPAPHRAPPGLRQRHGRTARRAAGRAAARLARLPALRRRDHGLPAQPQLLPRLHAGSLQRLRPPRPGQRPLRRQRPLRPQQLQRPQHLQLQQRQPRTGTDRALRTVRRLRPLGRASRAAARAAPASPPPTAPAPSSNRPSAAPA